jgi:hypothetical protein
VPAEDVGSARWVGRMPSRGIRQKALTAVLLVASLAIIWCRANADCHGMVGSTTFRPRPIALCMPLNTTMGPSQAAAAAEGQHGLLPRHNLT